MAYLLLKSICLPTFLPKPHGAQKGHVLFLLAFLYPIASLSRVAMLVFFFLLLFLLAPNCQDVPLSFMPFPGYNRICNKMLSFLLLFLRVSDMESKIVLFTLFDQQRQRSSSETSFSLPLAGISILIACGSMRSLVKCILPDYSSHIWWQIIAWIGVIKHVSA
jgi:hypothetical protein